MIESYISRVGRIVRPQGHVFYGWYIVGAASGVQMLAGLLWMQSYGAYVVLLQADFGWSKALVAGAFAMARIESGILGPLQGWLVDRFGPRAIMRIGTVIFGVGFLAFSQIDSLLQFYLAFAMIALGSSLGGFATVMVALVNWFDKHRAKAVSISQIGFSIGGLSVPLIILSLEAFGWRTTAFISGIVVFVVGLPLVQVIRHRPSEIGEQPDGTQVIEDPANPAGGFDQRRDFTAREAMRTASFWLISVGHACALLIVSTVMVHIVPHLTEGLGYSLSLAGIMVALMTGCQMLGQVLGGYLGDRYDKRAISTFCMMAHTAAMLSVAYATNIGLVMLFALLHGLAWGIRGPLMVALRADYFGPSSFGTIMGFSSLIVMLGMAGGPILAGYLADVYGSYEVGFTVLAVAAFVGSFCFIVARKPSLPDRQAARHL